MERNKKYPFFRAVKKRPPVSNRKILFLCAGQRHNYPIFYGNVSVCTQTSENTSATTKRAAFSRTSSYVTPTYFLAAFVKNKQFAKRAASANGAYNTVRDGTKTQARQRSAPLFHGRRINRRAQKSPYASPRRRTPRIFSPFRLRRKRGR